MPMEARDGIGKKRRGVRGPEAGAGPKIVKKERSRAALALSAMAVPLCLPANGHGVKTTGSAACLLTLFNG